MKCSALFTGSIVFLFLCFSSCKNEASVNAVPESAVVSPSTTKAVQTAKMTSMPDANKTGNLSWYSMNDVESLVKKDKKKILVDVYTKWCGPCKMMDARTFTDEAVQNAITEKFYPIKFDAEGNTEISFKDKTWTNPTFDPNKTRGRNGRHELAGFFSAPGYPTLIIMDENFNIIRKIVGYKTPEKLLAELATI